jgi:hypothetical protein
MPGVREWARPIIPLAVTFIERSNGSSKNARSECALPQQGQARLTNPVISYYDSAKITEVTSKKPLTP